MLRTVELDLPTAPIQGLEHALGRVLGTQEGGDQELATGIKLAHRQRLGDPRLRLFAHPRRAFRLDPDDQSRCRAGISTIQMPARSPAGHLPYTLEAKEHQMG